MIVSCSRCCTRFEGPETDSEYFEVSMATRTEHSPVSPVVSGAFALLVDRRDV